MKSVDQIVPIKFNVRTKYLYLWLREEVGECVLKKGLYWKKTFI